MTHYCLCWRKRSYNRDLLVAPPNVCPGCDDVTALFQGGTIKFHGGGAPVATPMTGSFESLVALTERTHAGRIEAFLLS